MGKDIESSRSPLDRCAVLLAVVSAVCCCGACHPLPAGALDAVRTPAGSSRRCEVVLVRGWRDLWSQGIDTLADEIRANGAHAEVYRESQWTDVADALVEGNGHLSPSQGPLVLIGFSFGADDVLRISQALAARGVAPDLVITIDPVTPPPVPPAIPRCYDYYQTNGIWDVFPWLRGVPLRSSVSGQLVNVDIRRDRSEWARCDLSHATIAANPKLHREIVERVMAVCRAN